jgi:hypothetical protein
MVHGNAPKGQVSAFPVVIEVGSQVSDVVFLTASDVNVKFNHLRCSRILIKRGFDTRDINISFIQNALHASHITRIRGLRKRLICITTFSLTRFS